MQTTIYFGEQSKTNPKHVNIRLTKTLPGLVCPFAIGDIIAIGNSAKFKIVHIEKDVADLVNGGETLEVYLELDRVVSLV